MYRFLFITFFTSFCIHAKELKSAPYKGVEYIYRELSDPRPIKVHIIKIDLQKQRPKFFVTESNGDSAGDTNLETTLNFVERKGADIGINGGFYSRNLTHKLLGISNLSSIHYSAGKLVSNWGKPMVAMHFNKGERAYFIFQRNGDMGTSKVQLFEGDEPYNIIAGHLCILMKGKVNRTLVDSTLHPRTAIGLAGGKYIILVIVDGRQIGVSEGMTYIELAKLMKAEGARSAMTLDGGGSSNLILRDPKSKKLEVKNVPSDGLPRAVGANLAIKLQD
ncbi:MAG: phosphodiester glycosidase family protein [Lentisphaeria bacterium]|nr:phosphodiester glycosidase family protein [Lentisphaeria bacterium]